MTGDRDTLTDEERLEALKAWQETWKDKGYPYPVPTASFLAGFDAAAARVRAACAQAWEEGAEWAGAIPLEGSCGAPGQNPYSDATNQLQNPED